MTQAGEDPTSADGSTIFGAIDIPAAGCRAFGALKIAGWAFSTVAPIVRVEAVLDDGEALTILRRDLPRLDVARTESHPGAARSGYSGRLRLPEGISGGHTI